MTDKPDDLDERHLAQARLLQSRMVQRLANMQPADVAALKPSDVARMWQTGVEVERQIAARSTSALAQELGFEPDTLDVAELSDADLEQLAEAIRAEKTKRQPAAHDQTERPDASATPPPRATQRPPRARPARRAASSQPKTRRATRAKPKP